MTQQHSQGGAAHDMQHGTAICHRLDTSTADATAHNKRTRNELPAGGLERRRKRRCVWECEWLNRCIHPDLNSLSGDGSITSSGCRQRGAGRQCFHFNSFIIPLNAQRPCDELSSTATRGSTNDHCLWRARTRSAAKAAAMAAHNQIMGRHSPAPHTNRCTRS